MQDRGAAGATRRTAPEEPRPPAATGAHPSGRGARRRYLEVATEVAAKVRPGVGRSYLAAAVELADLVERLGRSRSSLYRLWPSQHDFWHDLTLHLVFQNDYLKPDEWLPWDVSKLPVDVAPQRDPAADTELVRVTLGLIQDWTLQDPWIQVRSALLGYADVPEVAEARRRVEARRIRHLAARTAAVLALSGAGVAAPLQAIDVATGVWCLGDGFAVLNRSRPSIGTRVVELDRGLGPRPWGLFAYAAGHALTAMADPDAGPAVVDPDPGPTPAALYDEVSARWTESQRDALREATALFLERLGPPVPGAHAEPPAGGEIRSLGHVTVADVARQAGVSRRSVYNHWSSSEDLRLDLLRWLLAAERNRYVAGLDRVVASPPRAERARVDAVLAALLVHPAPNRIPIPHLPLAFLAEADHPAVRPVLERGHAEMVTAVASRVDRLWPTDRRATGADLDTEDLAVLLLSLVTGANRLRRIVPQALWRADRTLQSPPALVATLDPLVTSTPRTEV
ncbi:MAG TPA: TetR/AcrR family transcriptional regulator [Iamia sp.]|nr:TetR/AcrR family transcriptional regulator [Iamia sp.]